LCFFFAQIYGQHQHSWTSLIASGEPQSPVVREYHTLTLVAGSTKSVLFSGVTYNGTTTFNPDDTWVLDFANNNSFSKISVTNGPVPRGYHTGVATKDEVIIYGGRTESVDILSDVWRFNIATLQWTQDTVTGDVKPPIRSFHSAVLVDNLIYVFGAYAAEVFTSSNDLWAYDIVAKQWKVLIANGAAGSPPPRQGHAAVYSYDKTLGAGFIVFGGYNGKGGYNDAWRYYINSNKWAEIVVNLDLPRPEGRFGLSAASTDYRNVDGTEVLVFGGEFVGTNSEIYHNDVWSLRVTGNTATWVQLAEDSNIQGPWKRAGHASVKYSNAFYTFGGYGQYVGLYNDLWKFEYSF